MSQPWMTYNFPANTNRAVEKDFNAIFAQFGRDAAFSYLFKPVANVTEHNQAIGRARETLGATTIQPLIGVFNEPPPGPTAQTAALGITPPDDPMWAPPLWLIDADGQTFHMATKVPGKQKLQPTGEALVLPEVDVAYKR